MGTVRTPTAYLIAGGTIPLLSCSVCQSKTKKGDTFRAETAFDALPMGVAYFTTAKNIDAQIQINGTKVFDGVIDHTDYDWNERKITFTGRDKGSALMDKTTSQKFLNNQPTDIVSAFASAHGLRVVMDTPGGMAGKQYTTDLAKLTHRGSQWTVINELADLFGMVTYITGGTLYFKNYPESLPTYPITYTPPNPAIPSSNAIVLRTARNHILGRPVTTNVRSHNHKKKTLVTSTQTRTGSGEPLIYNHVIPGLTQDQADRIAKKKHAETTAHEMKPEIEIPGDETLTPLFMIQLSGTGTAFDQTYEITEVEHTVSYSGGFLSKISVKALSAQGGKTTAGPQDSQDQSAETAIKAKAQADLVANPSAASVNISTTLPSGASYSYTVSRNG